jgi:hypothetical protein
LSLADVGGGERSVVSSHASGSIVPMMKHGSFRFRESVVPGDIPRGKMGLALRHTPNHYLVLRPKVETVRLYDSWIAWDAFAKRRGAFLLVNLTFVCALASFCALGPALPLFCPVAMLRFTGTTELVLGGNSVTNSTGGSAGNGTAARFEAGPTPFEPWWGWGWDEAAEGLFRYACVSISIFFIMNTFQWNLAMMRLIWMTSKVRVCIMLAVTLLYTAAAGSLVPATSHLLWLFARVTVIVSICGADARLVTHRLRFKRDVFHARFGGGGKARGWGTAIVGVTGFTFAMCDLFRHSLCL